MAIIDWSAANPGGYGAANNPTLDNEATFTEGGLSTTVTVTGNLPDTTLTAYVGTYGADNGYSYVTYANDPSYSGFGIGNADVNGETINFSLSEPVRTVQLGFWYTNSVEEYAIFINGVQLTSAQLTTALIVDGNLDVTTNNSITGESLFVGDGVGLLLFDVASLGIAGGIESVSVEALHSIDPNSVRDFSGLSFGIDNIICISGDAFIATPSGEKRIRELLRGDRVLTLDNGPQEIRWIGKTVVDEANLVRNEKLRPFKITAGGLGPNIPNRDLNLSKQHRVILSVVDVYTANETKEMLAAIKDLIGLPNIEVNEEHGPVEYYHVCFDRHEIIYANGALVESMYLGAEAMKMVNAAGKLELSILFPDRVDASGQILKTTEPARSIVQGRRARDLVQAYLAGEKVVFGSVESDLIEH